jgi:hypothetical protein
MNLIGKVKKMDVDRDGKASGPYLRARVAIDVVKPLRRGVLLKTRKEGNPEWFEIQYEKLPFYCLSCGIMGHSELECDKPVIRNDGGKLPYDIKLRAPEIKKKKIHSFMEAAAESYGSGLSAGSKQSRGSASRSGDFRSQDSKKGAGRDEEEEVVSPLKTAVPESSGRGVAATHAKCQLFQAKEGDDQVKVRKRKSKGLEPSLTPDLNLPIIDTSALVPAGRVLSRVQQLAKNSDGAVLSALEELPKKQKRSSKTNDAGSAAAASSSPRRAQ